MLNIIKKSVLKGIKFDEKQIAEIEQYVCDLRDVKKYIEKEDCFITYEEYCKRKH